MKFGEFEIKFKHDTERRTTEARLLSPKSGSEIKNSIAITGKKDQFNRATGRRIALAKVINTLSREERIKIWEDFNDKFPVNKG